MITWIERFVRNKAMSNEYYLVKVDEIGMEDRDIVFGCVADLTKLMD